MTQKLPPDRDPELREALALSDGEQTALLKSMNGEPVEAAAALVPAPKAKKKPRRIQKPAPAEYRHPAERPSVETMLSDLSEATYDSGFGSHGLLLFPGWRVAAEAEANIYNNWVRLQCYRDGLLGPGELSMHDYIARYWSKGGHREGEL